MITADQLIVHAIGDYVIQSDWMANQKTKSWVPAIAHVVTYTPLFALLTTSWLALAVIALTHLFIDHWRLARYVCWAKNFPWPDRRAWRDCQPTGYPADRAPWMTVWLLIIVDNLMHITINAAAIRWL